MRYKALIIALFGIFAITNAHAVVLKVDIVNATKGEKMASYPFAVKITDIASYKSGGASESLEFKTGPDGFFENAVAIETGKGLMVEVNYRGISYFSRAVRVETGQETISLQVPVYNITDRKDDIAVTERHITLIPKDERAIKVYEQLTIENTGTSTYVGKFNDELDLNQVLYIPMPRGYVLTRLEGIPTTRIYTLSNGFVSREEIKPGTHTVFTNYRVTSDTGFFDFSLLNQKDAPEIRYASLYFPDDDGWDIKVSRLKSAGARTLGNRTYRLWKGEIGSAIHIKIYGPTYEGTTIFWTVSILLLFGVSLAGLYFLRTPVRVWHLKREKMKLKSMLAGLKDEDISGYYESFIRIVRDRLKEIDQRLKT